MRFTLIAAVPDVEPTILQLPYHQQNSEMFCGAAVAQMLLQSFGFGVLDQGTLNEMLPSGNQWFTKPESLQAILRNKKHEVDFQVHPDDSVSAACGRIARSIQSRGIAVPAAVIPSNHWVAVSGVSTRNIDGVTQLLGLYFNDPYPNEGLNLHGHSERDQCGSGSCFGVANAYATAYGWQKMHWSPDKPPFFTICEDSNTNASAIALAPPFPQQRPGDDSQVRSCAELGIIHEELASTGAPMAALLSKSTLGAVRKVSGQSYYSVDLINQSRLAMGAALIDMATGSLLQVQAFQHTPTTDSCRFSISADSAFALDRIQQFHAPECTLIEPPDYFWVPSVQAASPFHPLVRMRIKEPSGQVRTLFVRDDGVVLDNLTAFEYDSKTLGLSEFGLI